VGAKGWDILLSKTGFTNEAGHCLIMRIQQAGKNATLVLLDAKASAASRFDALTIRRFLSSPLLASSSGSAAGHRYRHINPKLQIH
jgi:serine-type D-Ala-D-Ala endopeptidase (penicillin-binding protein 7)